jgi:ubiquitin carboxyl-terminal hydrolase 25/28
MKADERQYEMAVNDYPGKTDHYRLCLTLIADAEGEERPGIKKFLSGAVGKPILGAS